MPRVTGSGSTVTKFRRDYLLASLLPLLAFLLLVLFSANVVREHLADLIADSTEELNRDAERSLQALGESILRNKARDVARQLSIYVAMHPGKSIAELRRDPAFMELAVQSVGRSGYTAVSEAADTYRILVHPNPKLIDFDMRKLAHEMPSWWEIVRVGIHGREAAGYYDWVEPDGSVRKKYLATTPADAAVDGVTLMVSATAYIDEFSAPIAAMQERAREIDDQYRQYVATQWQRFSLAFALLVLSAVSVTYVLGTRAARRFIDPIGDLAHAVREFGAGGWSTAGLARVATREDEIGILAQTFQRLSAQVVELFGSLEQRLGELKDAQTALQESEEHYRQLYQVAQQTESIYRSLIHSSADAIVMLDLGLRVTYLSPVFTRIFGWTEDDLRGRRIPYIPKAERRRALEILQQVVEDGVAFHGYETQRTTKDGALVDVSVSASRFDDHEGRPKGVLAILRDLSEKKRVEAQMQRLDRLEAIGTLAGGVAHDFNNLLTVIQGNVSLLKSELPPSGEGYESLLEIEEAIRSGASLTRQLLGFARKGRYEVAVADLNDTVEKIASAVRRTRKDVVLRLDLAADLLPIEADFHQMEQVLLNLYINACDAMPDGGEITISTRNVSDPSGPRVRLRVSDSGSGMDPEILDHIFDPFFTTKGPGRGTGLGLASAYGIVEAHGGRIEVASSPGAGSTFTVLLPATREEPSAPVAAPGAPTRGEGTVLVIDDEEKVLSVAARLIRSLGYEVRTAPDGATGIEIYRSDPERIDLVVLDMIMPGMSGGQVFERLREIDPDVAVLLSSGYSIDSRATQEMLRTCRGLVQKPYTLEELAAKLRAALRVRETGSARRDAEEGR